LEAGLTGPSEVLLVDSASTDRTVDIARALPVRIVQLRAHWPLSASAGRHIGRLAARGRRLLFVDGDFALARGFLVGALPYLKGDVAAVCGTMREQRSRVRSVLTDRLEADYARGDTREPEAVPIGLYDREALDRVGSYEPYLRGGDDREVARRLRAKGYRIRQVRVPMGIHFWSDREVLDYMTYFLSVANWSFGDGQVVRGLVRGAARRALLRRYFNARFLVGHWMGLALGGMIAASLSFLAVPSVWPASVLAAGVLVASLLAAKSRGRSTWRELAFELHAIPYTLIRIGCLLLGMLRGVRPAASYPRDYVTIQDPDGGGAA
jgi:glycosyltransferase involved in cell wall biosynthesis